jgi:hypothetical protein
MDYKERNKKYGSLWFNDYLKAEQFTAEVLNYPGITLKQYILLQDNIMEVFLQTVLTSICTKQ